MSTDYMLKKSTHYHIVNLFLDSDTLRNITYSIRPTIT